MFCPQEDEYKFGCAIVINPLKITQVLCVRVLLTQLTVNMRTRGYSVGWQTTSHLVELIHWYATLVLWAFPPICELSFPQCGCVGSFGSEPLWQA